MNQKRITLRKVAGVSAVAALAPTSWIKPVISSVILPAHAQTSDAENSLRLRSFTALCGPDSLEVQSFRVFVDDQENDPIIRVEELGVKGPITLDIDGNSLVGQDLPMEGELRIDQLVARFDSQIEIFSSNGLLAYLRADCAGDAFQGFGDASFHEREVVGNLIGEKGTYRGVFTISFIDFSVSVLNETLFILE